MPRPTDTTAWRDLLRHAEAARSWTLADLFAADPERTRQYRVAAAGLRLDYGRQLLTDAILERLITLYREMAVERWRDGMFAGERINVTERRAVLHVALRDLDDAFGCAVDGVPVHAAVMQELGRVEQFVGRVRSGDWLGYSGRPITDVVNLGIGGSDLGPRMACAALQPYHDGPRIHFVANVDGHAIDQVLRGVDRDSVLFVVASKSFTTQETLTNARTARAWLLDGGAGEAAVARHFVAVSTDAEAVAAFGIDPANRFGFWDWVGGRYSLWSAIGLPVALAVGMPNFLALLRGAHLMDRHFREAPAERNLPVVLALLGIWNRNFLDRDSVAVIPYDHRLRLLPGYLQQLDMESNGKRVTRGGEPVSWPTGPVVWGGVGTDAQHAFFQLLHQGTVEVPVEFLLVDQPHHGLAEHHRILLANGRAQARALAEGRSADQLDDGAAELAPHRLFPGNRVSTTLTIERLAPESLGALVALYEHKVFVQGCVWDIDSFDQWGVELGKEIAGQLLR